MKGKETHIKIKSCIPFPWQITVKIFHIYLHKTLSPTQSGQFLLPITYCPRKSKLFGSKPILFKITLVTFSQLPVVAHLIGQLSSNLLTLPANRGRRGKDDAVCGNDIVGGGVAS